MTMSKNDLKQLAHQIEQGQYVKKSTVYIVAVIALGCGLFLGNLITTLYAPNVTVSQNSAPAPAPQQSGVSPQAQSQIASTEAALVNDMKNVRLWNKLGNLYFDSSQFTKAIKAYTSSLDIDPKQPNVLTDLGVMYRRAGQPANAIKSFDKALQFDPMHQTAKFNKGIVLYYDLEKRSEAISTWKMLLAQNPNAKAPNGQPLSELIKNLAN